MAKVKAVRLTAAGVPGGLLHSLLNKPKPKTKGLNPAEKRKLKADVVRHMADRDKFVKETGTHKHIIRVKTKPIEAHGRMIDGLHFHHTYIRKADTKPIEYHKGGVKGVTTLPGFTGWSAEVNRTMKNMHNNAMSARQKK